VNLPATIVKLLDSAQKQFRSIRDTPALDVQVILAFILDRPRAWVIAHPEYTLNTTEKKSFQAALDLYSAGYPLPYILGEQEFFGISIAVTPHVLIPRPETELLVELALTWLKNHPDYRFAADVGTGSGCIAISLSLYTPDLTMIASDISRRALQVAAENATRHGVRDRVHLLQNDLLPILRKPYHLICANLPYIPSSIYQSLPVANWEPALALDGGADGLTEIRRLLHMLTNPTVLAPGGRILLEIEATTGNAALNLANLIFPQAQIQLIKDLAGLDRIIVIDLPHTLA
jgi:release factor glutamine methyltransferase